MSVSIPVYTETLPTLSTGVLLREGFLQALRAVRNDNETDRIHVRYERGKLIHQNTQRVPVLSIYLARGIVLDCMVLVSISLCDIVLYSALTAQPYFVAQRRLANSSQIGRWIPRKGASPTSILRDRYPQFDRIGRDTSSNVIQTCIHVLLRHIIHHRR